MRALGSLLVCLAAARLASADVVLDGSLGPAGPVPLVGTDRPIPEDLGRRSGPENSGPNLFHSFSDLSLPAGQSATFSAVAPTSNVIARVTGGVPSVIAGTLRSFIPGASLWLLNPSGVVFAPTGRLLVSGSFHATTADALHFADDLVFPAAGGGEAVLSSAAPAHFGFLSDAPVGLGVDRSLLTVPTGAVLSLVGGDVDVVGSSGPATLRASGGRIQLGSVAGPGKIPVDLAAFDPGASDAPALGNVSFRDGAALAVSSPSGGGVGNGTVVVRAGEVNGAGASVVATNTQAVAGALLGVDMAASRTIDLDATRLEANVNGAGPGGGLRLAAPEITVRTGSQVLARSLNAGRGGDVELDGSSVDIVGGSLERTRVGTSTSASGAGGDVRVFAESVDVMSGAELSAVSESAGPGGKLRVEAASVRIVQGDFDPSLVGTRASGSGPGGDLDVVTDTLEVSEGAELSAVTTGAGDAGSLTVTASEWILLRGDPNPLESTGIFARTGCAGVGAPGCAGGALPLERTGRGADVVLETGSLDVEAGAVISARSFGAGDAGRVEIDARDVVRVDGSEGEADSLISVRGDLGNGGALDVAADRVELALGGALTSTATSAGDAGSVVVTAREFTASGVDPQSGLASGIYAETIQAFEEPGLGVFAGDAGDVVVRASESAVVEQGARLSVRTRGPGASGSVDVSARVIRVASNAAITAESTSPNPGAADAGNVGLTAVERVDVLDGAELSAEAVRADGGNVAIRAGKIVLVRDATLSACAQGAGCSPFAGLAEEPRQGGNVLIDPDVVALQRASVTANANQFGGNFEVTASGFFVDASEIDVSGAFEGTVQVDAPETDLSGALAELSAAFADREALLRSPCEARREQTGSFVARGLAALPPPPGGALASEYGPSQRLAATPAPADLDALPLHDAHDVLRALGRCPGESTSATR